VTRRAARPAGAAALLSIVLCAGAMAQAIYPGDAVRVNGTAISYQRFHGFYVEYRNSKGVAVGARGDQLDLLTRLRKEAMDRLIEQELVRQAAVREGIEVKPEAVDEAVADLRAVFDDELSFNLRLKDEGFTLESYREHVAQLMAAKWYIDRVRVAVAEVSDEDLEAYYRANERRLTLPEQVRVRHILLTWKPMGTGDDRAAIREQMKPILARARAGEDFAALAREYSDDFATKAIGGDTGLFARGKMVPAFERVAFSLEPGEISDPVETVFGVHILRLEEHHEARLLPLDEVREQLREHIREERMEKAERDEIERLREEAEIQVLIPLETRASTK